MKLHCVTIFVLNFVLPSLCGPETEKLSINDSSHDIEVSRVSAPPQPKPKSSTTAIPITVPQPTTLPTAFGNVKLRTTTVDVDKKTPDVTTTAKSTVPTTPITTTAKSTTPSSHPTTPTSATTTVKPAPTPTPTNGTSTTVAPASPTTPAPTPAPTKAPGGRAREFDGPSFFGGIILCGGLTAIGFIGFKFYKARTERNYHTFYDSEL